MVTFSGCVFDGAGGKEQPLPKQLIRAIEDKEYNRAYALLRRMRREGVALEEGKRAEALADALTCTLKLFKTLYEQVFADVPDEGVWLTTSFERVCGSVSLHGCVRGTLLTLAAALDRPEHAKYLIEKGYDVNGLLPPTPGISEEEAEWEMGFDKYSFVKVSVPKTDDPKCAGGTILIRECTPLAAAIAGASLTTAELFSKRDDVWREESPAVCCAVAYALNPNRGIENMPEECEIGMFQRWCAEDVFPELRQEIFSDEPHTERLPKLRLDAIVGICTPKLLEQQLRLWTRSEEEAHPALKNLAVESDYWMNDSRAYKAKFLMFKQYFPAMCHEAWAAGAFLSALRRPDMQDASFTECCLGLWDDAIDLTWVSYLEPKKDAAFLRCLDGRRVLLNADAFSVVRCEKEGTAELAYWINRADIEPSCFTEGVSVLSYCLITTASVKLLREPKIQELLRHEPRDALQQALKTTKNSTVRAAVLLACKSGSLPSGNAARLAEYDCPDCPSYSPLHMLRMRHRETRTIMEVEA